MTADDIETLDAARYSLGADPIDVATSRVRVLLTVWASLQQRSPAAPPLPGWEALDVSSMSRRLVGEFLAAQWTPPTSEDVAEAAERWRQRDAAYKAWLAGLSIEERLRMLDHYSRTGTYPPGLEPPS